jgi:hypothetical protein
MMPGIWGRKTGGMLQGIRTAGRSFLRRPGLKQGCCANDDDDDDVNSVDNFVICFVHFGIGDFDAILTNTRQAMYV